MDHNACKQIGIHEVLIFDTLPTGRAKHRTDLIDNTAWLDDMIDSLIPYNQDPSYPGVVAYAYMTSHRSVGCSCGTSYFYISPYGDVNSCDFNHAQFGNVLETLTITRKVLRALSVVNDLWGESMSLNLAAKAIWQTQNPNWQQVEANLAQSVILLRQIRARPDLARTYLLQRRLYDRAGRSAWAIDCHYRAIQLFEELNMTGELRQAQGQSDAETITPGISRHIELLGPHWQPD